MDVGGDDIGATALGQYAQSLEKVGCCLLYVVNANRALTHTPAEAADMLADIEAHARLAACGVVNCTNLGAETTWDTVERGRPWALEVARLTGLPLVATVVPQALKATAQMAAGAGIGSDTGPETADVNRPKCDASVAKSGGESATAHEELLFVERCVTTPWE